MGTSESLLIFTEYCGPVGSILGGFDKEMCWPTYRIVLREFSANADVRVYLMLINKRAWKYTVILRDQFRSSIGVD